MSKQTVWNGLRRRGLSEEVTAAIMGNMEAESAFISNNVENRCPISDAQYTANVDNGTYSRHDFMYDNGQSYGYGLCQWTFWSRKAALYDFAKQRNVSIGDEEMQLDFFFTEGEWKAIANDMNCLSVEEGAKLFMLKHENPADKSEKAQRYRASLAIDIYNEMRGCSCEVDNSPTIAPNIKPENCEPVETCDITVRVLKFGDKGRDVYMAQCGLNDCGYSCGKADGIFGNNTLAGVADFRQACNLSTGSTGNKQEWAKVDQDVWQILFQ